MDYTEMEDTSVMDDKKNKRFSILKPPKQRNPLSDVDLGEPTLKDESLSNTMRMSRRVSFANSNLVKQFTADPDKNTIWDSTYEETVDSDQSSNPHNVIQKTIISEQTMEITLEENNAMKMMANSKNKTIIGNDDLELTDMLTVTATNAEHENCTIYSDDIEITEQFGQMQANKENNVTNWCTESLELTECLVTKINTPSNNTSYAEKLSLTQPLNIQTYPKANETMEFTQIPEMCLENEEVIHKIETIRNEEEVSNTCMLSAINHMTSMNITGGSIIAFAKARRLTLKPPENCKESMQLTEEIKQVEKSCDKNASEFKLIEQNSQNFSMKEDVPIKNIDCHISSVNNEDFEVTNKENFNYTNITQDLSRTHSVIDDTQHLINYKLPSDLELIIQNKNKTENFNKTQKESQEITDELNINKDSKSIEQKDLLNSVSEINNILENMKTVYDVLKDSAVIGFKAINTSDSSEGNIITDKNVVENISQENVILVELETTTSNTDQLIRQSTSQISKHLSVIETVSDNSNQKLFEEFQRRKDEFSESIRLMLLEKDPVPAIIVSELEPHLAPLPSTKLPCIEQLEKRFSKFEENKERVLKSAARMLDEIGSFKMNLEEPVVEKVKPPVKTVDELFKERFDGCKLFIKNISKENEHAFLVLWGSVKITVNLLDYEVTDFKVESCIKETATPSAFYVNKIFLSRFTPESVSLAIGSKFDVISLLDYALILCRQLHEFLKLEDELHLSNCLRMDSNFKVDFQVKSMSPLVLWEVTVNLANFQQNIDVSTITANAIVGQVNMTTLKKIAAACKHLRGFDFLKEFIEKIDNHVASFSRK